MSKIPEVDEEKSDVEEPVGDLEVEGDLVFREEGRDVFRAYDVAVTEEQAQKIVVEAGIRDRIWVKPGETMSFGGVEYDQPNYMVTRYKADPKLVVVSGEVREKLPALFGRISREPMRVQERPGFITTILDFDEEAWVRLGKMAEKIVAMLESRELQNENLIPLGDLGGLAGAANAFKNRDEIMDGLGDDSSMHDEQKEFDVQRETQVAMLGALVEKLLSQRLREKGKLTEHEYFDVTLESSLEQGLVAQIRFRSSDVEVRKNEDKRAVTVRSLRSLMAQCEKVKEIERRMGLALKMGISSVHGGEEEDAKLRIGAAGGYELSSYAQDQAALEVAKEEYKRQLEEETVPFLVSLVGLGIVRVENIEPAVKAICHSTGIPKAFEHFKSDIFRELAGYGISVDSESCLTYERSAPIPTPPLFLNPEISTSERMVLNLGEKRKYDDKNTPQEGDGRWRDVPTPAVAYSLELHNGEKAWWGDFSFRIVSRFFHEEDLQTVDGSEDGSPVQTYAPADERSYEWIALKCDGFPYHGEDGKIEPYKEFPGGPVIMEMLFFDENGAQNGTSGPLAFCYYSSTPLVKDWKKYVGKDGKLRFEIQIKGAWAVELEHRTG